MASVVLGHVALIWGLTQLAPVRAALAEMSPVTVRIVSVTQQPEPLPQPALPKPRRQELPTVPPLDLPVIPTVAPLPMPVVAEAPPRPAPPEPVPAAVAAPAAPVVVAAVVPPPAPVVAPAPKVLPASAVSYRLPPLIEVPLASRRMNESGTVVLRVRVGRDGVPLQVSVQRSSGFARLDEQAANAMRAARFNPYVENGQAQDCVVIAPFQYELE